MKLPTVPASYSPAYERQRNRLLQAADRENVKVRGERRVYTVTNGTTDRTYDADSTTVAELADLLYTLLSDLEERGILSLE